MASFKNVLYLSDGGKNYTVRMSAADIAAQPTTAVTGTPDVPGKLKLSKSRKSFGLHARRVNLSRVVGTAPNEKVLYDHLYVLKPADVATLIAAATVTINGTSWVVNNSDGEFTR